MGVSDDLQVIILDPIYFALVFSSGFRVLLFYISFVFAQVGLRLDQVVGKFEPSLFNLSQDRELTQLYSAAVVGAVSVES